MNHKIVLSKLFQFLNANWRKLGLLLVTVGIHYFCILHFYKKGLMFKALN